MSKGGDTTTTSTTSTLPDYVKPYYTDLLKKAKTVSNQEYTPYEGDRLAGFSGDTNNAFKMIREQAAGGTPAVDDAITGAGGISGYNAGHIGSTNVTTNGIAGADLKPYMDPYINNVLDVQKNRATQTFQEQQAGRDAAAVGAGAFGGDRRFVSDSLAQRDLNNQLDDINATGLSAAYNNATNLFETDEARRTGVNVGNADRGLSASIANEDARRQGKTLALNADQLLGQLGQTKNDIGLQNAEALSGVGAKIQQRKQAGLDMAYSDFQNQQNWPAKQLSLYSQLLSGTPVSANATTSTTAPAPDFLSQLLGLASSGAGLAGLLGG